ncbi:hypothetical protein WJX73_009061 [Symbiochloris irregularis]|uniref:Deoxynucleoside kinase domain-containing protein n=1 Tax=Symbiochloris irregularis TaxID=706552 RepID=A0AAW1NJ79_9CHLO
MSNGKASRDAPERKPQPVEKRSELMGIKYVGPKNMHLLRQQNVETMLDLVERFNSVADASTSKMVDYLRGEGTTVGASFPGEAWTDIGIVPEPVSEWQNLSGGGGNILDAFYNEPERYAYTFQNYVFLTRCLQKRNSPEMKFRLLERSVFSDRMVFVRAVHQAKHMSDLELSLYNSWFDPMVSDFMPDLVPDGFIYLHAPPGTCQTRMHKRGRSEEDTVKIEYLHTLHGFHEDWLNTTNRPYKGYSNACLPRPDLVDPHGRTIAMSLGKLDATNSQDDVMKAIPPPAIIRDSLVQLSKLKCQDLHKCIENTPALVLNCGDVDLTRDSQARQQYSDLVQTYFQWVKQCKQASSAKATADNLEPKDREILRRAMLNKAMWGDDYFSQSGLVGCNGQPLSSTPELQLATAC